ncbi:MAG: methyltransferase domain-containing protein [Gammaproteobacteria bacterium]
MLIRTDEVLMQNREHVTLKIAKFWDQISEGWRTVWGEHIHHGYYENNQILTPKKAQEKLIEKLCENLSIFPETNILDAGCGMGGSSMYLSEKYGANVLGITLSSKQALIARQEAKERNINNVTFKVEDALALSSLKDNSFDIVWSLESCEQMFDKALFANQVFRVLKPGGKFLLVTWCSSQDSYEGRLAKKYKKLCMAFDLPYMPTMDWYSNMLVRQQFALTAALDWSDYVKKSWEIGISLANAYSFFHILRIAGWRGLRFSQQAKMMQNAFHEGRVRYGVFLAEKGVKY